jgi:hypothetical protein
MDVSPKVKNMTFKNALKLSCKNFEYFLENKQQLLVYNILHGDNVDEINTWFNAVKDYNFDGWAIGGINDVKDIAKIELMLTLIPEKSNVHFLGLYDFKLIAMLKNIEDKSEFEFSFDTSLPSILANNNVLIENGIMTKSNNSYLDLLVSNINYIYLISG